MSLNKHLGTLDEPSPEGDTSPDAIEGEPASPEVGQTPAEAAPEAKADAKDSTPPAATPATEAPVEPFEFGGRSWASREEAEHSWKSWEGRIQAEQARSKELDKMAREYWDYVQTVSKENDELRARFEKPAEPAAEPEKAPAIDFDQIGRLMQVAQNNGLDPMQVGIKAYAQQAEKVYEAKLNERLSAVEQPLQDIQLRNEEIVAEQKMFVWAQGVTRNDGSVAFPELQKDGLQSNGENAAYNTAFTSLLYRNWKTLAEEFGNKYAYSVPGFDYAYRLTKDSMPQPAPATPAAPARTETPPVGRDAQGRFTSLNDDARAASEITGTQTNPTKRSDKNATQAALEELTAMKPVKIGETDLGFYS